MSAARQPLPLDDPGVCVDLTASSKAAAEADANAVEAELQRRINEQWPPIRACLRRSKTTEPVHIEIEVGADGNSRARVIQAQLTDCAAIACIRKRLSGLRVATPNAERRLAFSQVLDLAPQATQRFRAEPRLEHFEKPAQPACLDDRAYGRLRAEVIRQRVREAYDRFGKCYEAGLGRHPQLRGRVGVRFVIDGDGKIQDVTVIDNEVGDCAVVRCIRDEFRTLTFPAPEGGGIVTVIYPIMFEPASGSGDRSSNAKP